MTKKTRTFTVQCEAASWVVTCADGTVDKTGHRTKDDAVWFARRLASKHRPSHLVICSEDGVRAHFNYNQAPAPWPK